MEYELTLPALQRRLDHLATSQTLTLASNQVESLFELNDVAIASSEPVREATSLHRRTRR